MANVNEGMIQMLMNMQTVDIVALLPNAPRFDFG